MCGILGLVSDKTVENELLDELEKLEYRGYDSAGLGLQTANGLQRKRTVGGVSNLNKYGKKCLYRSGRHFIHDGPRMEKFQTNAHPHGSQTPGCKWY